MIVLALAVATVYLYNKKTAFMERVQLLESEEKDKEQDAEVTKNADGVHTLPKSSDIVRQINSKNVDSADYDERLSQGQRLQIKKLQDAEADRVAAYNGSAEIQGVMLVYDNL
jgi:hypothetical protein